MRRLTLLFLLLPFVAVWAYGCDQTKSPIEPQAEEAATPASFAVEKKAKSTGLVGVEVVVASSGSLPATAGSTAFPEAECPDGKWPISGGFLMIPADDNYEVMGSYPKAYSL